MQETLLAEERLGQTLSVELPEPAVSGYRVHVARTVEEIQELRPFWLKMNTHPDVEPDFYSFINAARAEVLSPFVVVATQNGQPATALVGRIEDTRIPIKIGYWVVSGIRSRQIAFLPEGLLGDCTAALARALILELVKALHDGVAHRVVIVNADIDSELYRNAKALTSIWLRDYSGQTTENWRTKLACTMEEFLQRRSKRSRQHFRHISRVFEEHFGNRLRYQMYEGASQVESFCKSAEEIARTTYQRGLGSGFFNNAESRGRLALSADKGWWRSYMAFVGDEPVGFWCGRLYNGVMYLDWTGYKPAYRKWEVGTILFLKMVEDLCNAGATAMDYGSGGGFYKERFGDEKRDGASIAFYSPTSKGLAMRSFKTLETVTNASARWVAGNIGILNSIKRQWRRRLSVSAPGDGHRGGGDQVE
jgi:CelD/BcsL family acetyltransferase involved in cellulose biosynthesis